jgi:hypothetical protein
MTSLSLKHWPAAIVAIVFTLYIADIADRTDERRRAGVTHSRR